MVKYWSIYMMNIALVYACWCSNNQFNVLDYGAVNSVHTDSSLAFQEAWNIICKTEVHNPTLVVPQWQTFLVNPSLFVGPCKPDRINFQLSGEIVAPPSPSAWEKHDPSQWLAFKEVNGLHFYGGGRINGQGLGWWNQSCRYHPHTEGCTKLAPTAMKFIKCDETTLTGINFINSSQTHITLVGCNEVQIDQVTIKAPGNSPNTDGIHLQHAHHVIITNTAIGTGDDCISIGDHTSNIDIMNVTCGPGHGISIGSLGRGGSYAQVQNILVKDAYFKGTTNGARIKTWREGRGYVKQVIFENLFFNAVRNPLIIDQHYGTVKGTPTQKEEESGVSISQVTYKNVYGTSASEVAINLNCSEYVACVDITLDSVMLWPASNLPKEVTSYCSNAYGASVGAVRPPSCIGEATDMGGIIDLLMHIRG